jgi:hypothetical protein
MTEQEREELIAEEFARLCADPDVICEAIGPDAWGSLAEINAVARRLGGILAAIRADLTNPLESSDEMMLSFGSKVAGRAHDYIERIAERKVDERY